MKDFSWTSVEYLIWEKLKFVNVQKPKKEGGGRGDKGEFRI